MRMPPELLAGAGLVLLLGTAWFVGGPLLATGTVAGVAASAILLVGPGRAVIAREARGRYGAEGGPADSQQLLDSVSRALRTPVAELRGIAQQLRDRDLPPDGPPLVASLDHAIERLDDLTGMVTSVTEALAGHTPAAAPQQVDLRETVADAACSLRRLGGIERVRYRATGSDRGHATSPELVRLLVMCLLEPALRATDEAVEVTAAPADGSVRVQVHSPGAAGAQPPRGSLSLILAQRIAERLGAAVITASSGGGAMNLAIDLPLHTGNGHDPERAAESTPQGVRRAARDRDRGAGRPPRGGHARRVREHSALDTEDPGRALEPARSSAAALPPVGGSWTARSLAERSAG